MRKGRDVSVPGTNWLSEKLHNLELPACLEDFGRIVKGCVEDIFSL